MDPRVAKRKGEAPLDNWSWVHLAAGIGLGAIGVPTLWGMGLIAGFEVLEGGLRQIKTTKRAGGLFQYESWPNIIADIIVGAAGFFLGQGARWLWFRFL